MCLAVQKSVRLQAYAGRRAENCGFVVHDGWGRQVGVQQAESASGDAADFTLCSPSLTSPLELYYVLVFCNRPKIGGIRSIVELQCVSKEPEGFVWPV